MQVMVLEGGIKGWVQAGPQYTQLMDGFDGAHWQRLFAEQEVKPEAPIDQLNNTAEATP